jgi:uncharacterized coiled-coil protein SlyX
VRPFWLPSVEFDHAMTADVSTSRTTSVPSTNANDSPVRAAGSAGRSAASPSVSKGLPVLPPESPIARSPPADGPRRSVAHDGDPDPVRVAERALRALLGQAPPPSGTVARAATALEALNVRLEAQATLYGRIAELEEIAARERKVAQEAVLNVEQNVIETKIAYAGLLEEKDAVSRDLAIAKRELRELDSLALIEQDSAIVLTGGDPGATRPHSGTSKNSAAAGDPTNVQAEEQRIEMLEMQAAADLAKLKELDNEIVGMTEEIDRIQKQRMQLQQKYAAAYDDF